MRGAPSERRPQLARLCLKWLDVAAWIVPPALRRDWRAEWRGEVESFLVDHEAGRNGHQLVRRCLGAVAHAAWIRKEEWSADMFSQDFLDAKRVLLARPGFTLLAALTLALGIGATTVIFSVVDAVLLKPLPYRDPARLVQLWETNPLRDWTQATIAPANLLDWRERNRVFEDIAAYMGSDSRDAGLTNYTLNEGAEPERVRGLLVSANYFRVLGVAPVIGRDFLDDESVPGKHRVVVLSNGLWKRRFGGDPGLVGRAIRMGPYQYTVAGVMPTDFRFGGPVVDFWAPLAHTPESWRALRKPHFLRAIARLKPGVSPDQAREDLSRIATALEQEYPATNTKMGVGLGPIDDWFVGDVRLALLLFLGAVGCLLLIACANVSNLMLARAVGRAREMAIRTALGAGRLRLVRQLLSESLLLSFVGGGLATVVATWGVRVFRAVAPASLPRLEDVRIDTTVLVFTAAVACVSAFVFGLAPALHLARTDAAEALSATARSGAGSARLTRRLLVVAEVAMAFVLVVAAGLMARSFVRLQHVDPGFDPSNILTARISLPAQYDTDAKMQQFYERTVDAIRTLPGVRAAGASSRIALEGYAWTGDLAVQGRPDVWGRELRHKSIVPGYFEAMGLPLLSGRSFTAHDDGNAPPVVVVNQTLAREFFRGENPVGRAISFTRPTEPPKWKMIVGVVGDEKQDGLEAPVRPEVYRSHLQEADDTMTLVVRCASAPSSVAPLLRRAVARVDPGVALFDVRTMEDRLATAVGRQRFNLWLFASFGCAALALAAIGVAGLVGFSVSSRTREIGVRVAVGATRAEVIGLVLLDSLRLCGAGVAFGVLGSLAAGRWLSTLLFQTASSDPATIVLMAAFLLLVTAAAAWIPARRAASVDPISALRSE